MKAYKKQLKQRQLAQKVQNTCTHCQRKGHVISQCLKLHPNNHHKQMQQEYKRNGEIGTKDSIIDLRTDVSHEEDL